MKKVFRTREFFFSVHAQKVSRAVYEGKNAHLKLYANSLRFFFLPRCCGIKNKNSNFVVNGASPAPTFSALQRRFIN